MQGTLLLALLMERNNQEKWSEDICFRVIVLNNIVDWMLISFSSQFLSDRCCLVYGNSRTDCVYCLKTVFYEWSKEVPRSVQLR